MVGTHGQERERRRDAAEDAEHENIESLEGHSTEEAEDKFSEEREETEEREQQPAVHKAPRLVDKEARSEQDSLPLERVAARRNTEAEQREADEELRNAAYHNELDKAKRLVESCGANLLAKDYQGGTPMHYAALEGHVAVLQYFVDKGGADLVHATDKVGGTPLPVACFWGRLESARYLVSVGADIEAKDKKGFCARDKAFRQGHHEIVAWIDGVLRSRNARKRWRAAGRGVAALLALYERAVARVYAPGGAGYQEARARFEAAQQ